MEPGSEGAVCTNADKHKNVAPRSAQQFVPREEEDRTRSPYTLAEPSRLLSIPIPCVPLSLPPAHPARHQGAGIAGGVFILFYICGRLLRVCAALPTGPPPRPAMRAFEPTARWAGRLLFLFVCTQRPQRCKGNAARALRPLADLDRCAARHRCCSRSCWSGRGPGHGSGHGPGQSGYSPADAADSLHFGQA